MSAAALAARCVCCGHVITGDGDACSDDCPVTRAERLRGDDERAFWRRRAPCLLCGTPTDEPRTPTYEDRDTGERRAITPGPVWVCSGCTYEAANFLGRYVDERAQPAPGGAA